VDRVESGLQASPVKGASDGAAIAIEGPLDRVAVELPRALGGSQAPIAIEIG
jgi:hypothetical protein